MANVLLLKRRITAAQNVSKTTRAMQMIATSKLKRAEEAAVSGRPYSGTLTNLSQNLMERLEEKDFHDYMKSPQSSNKNLLIVISPDKGLCGALIADIIHELLQFNSNNPNTIYIIVGKKVEAHISSLGKEIIASFKFGTTLPAFDMVYPILSIIDDYFLNQKVRSVKILSSHFKSIFSQIPKVRNILPIEISKTSSNENANIAGLTLFEPRPQDLLPSLLKHYLEIVFYQNLLEAYASEQAARMLAMKNATDNAIDISNELRLEYNKARQEKITNEILDIGNASFSNNYEQ